MIKQFRMKRRKQIKPNLDKWKEDERKTHKLRKRRKVIQDKEEKEKNTVRLRKGRRMEGRDKESEGRREKKGEKKREAPRQGRKI